jgi:O-antigen/teichoic acid export membrane protein
MLGVSLVTYANGNADRATVGGVLGKAELGFYEYAANIPLMLVNMFTRVVNTVLFPAFSSLQDRPEELQRLLVKVYRYNAMLVFPVLVGIGVVAEEFVLVAYGDKWLPILQPLRLFAVAGALQLYSRPLYILCNSLGRPNLPFRWALIYLPINLVLIVAGARLAGLTGVVGARIVMPVFMVATLGVQIMRVVGLSWLRVFRATVPALLGAAAMGAAVLAAPRVLTILPAADLPRLLLLVLLGGLTYAAILGVFFRDDLRGLLALMRRRS